MAHDPASFNAIIDSRLTRLDVSRQSPPLRRLRSHLAQRTRSGSSPPAGSSALFAD